MTRDRLVAIRRFFTYGEPCEPEMTPHEIDVIFRMAETALARDVGFQWQPSSGSGHSGPCQTGCRCDVAIARLGVSGYTGKLGRPGS